jgi:hydrogenase-4 transcriptional activator
MFNNREVERVGGKRSIPVDIRVIAATHRNLQSMVANGSFREDLWYRLSGFPIVVPPVRQRKEDVPALTRHFVTVKSMDLGIGVPPSIAPGALLRLMEYDWPGNVRELENLVERELILHREGALTFSSILPGSELKSVPLVASGDRHLYPLNLDEANAMHIKEVLKLADGKIDGPGGAAEMLGINASTLRSRLNKFGVSYRRRGRDNR